MKRGNSNGWQRRILLRTFAVVAVAGGLLAVRESISRWRAAIQQKSQAILDRPVDDFFLEKATFKGALDRLSAKTGVPITCVTDEALPDQPVDDAVVGVPTITYVEFSLHLRNTTLQGVLDVLLEMANDEEDTALFQREVTPDGKIVVWEARKQPLALDVFDVSDLLAEDGRFARSDLPVDPTTGLPTHAAEIAASKERLSRLIQAYSPGEWNSPMGGGWNLRWVGSKIAVIAPPPQCAQVSELIRDLRENGNNAHWPSDPLLERMVPAVSFEAASWPEAADRLSGVFGTNVAAIAWVRNSDPPQPIKFELPEGKLYRSLERLCMIDTRLSSDKEWHVVRGGLYICPLNGLHPTGRWSVYDVREIERRYHDGLRQLSYDRDRDLAGYDGLIEVMTRQTRSELVSSDDLFAGRIVLRPSSRTDLRYRALLDLLARGTSNSPEVEIPAMDGPLLQYVDIPELRLYRCRDIIDSYSRWRMEHPDDYFSAPYLDQPPCIGLRSVVEGRLSLLSDYPHWWLGDTILLNASSDVHRQLHDLLVKLRSDPNAFAAPAADR